MLSHHMQLRVPDSIFRRLKARAEFRHRTVEEELIALAAQLTLEDDRLSSDQEERLDAVRALTDAELWSVLRQPTHSSAARTLARLNQKQAAATLTEAEARKHARLVEQCEWAMLVRAQAAKLLADRGHNVMEVLQP